MDWLFLPIDSSFKRNNFDCNNPELNEYLQKYARQNHRKGIATTFVAIANSEEREVIGYYSVCMSEIKQEFLPYTYQKGLPRYPLPAMKIAKLAVHRSMQGRGLGKALLMECFRKAIALSLEIGIYAITVDATNEQAKNFYLKYGFIALEDNPLALFIPIKTLLAEIQ